MTDFSGDSLTKLTSTGVTRKEEDFQGSILALDGNKLDLSMIDKDLNKAWIVTTYYRILNLSCWSILRRHYFASKHGPIVIIFAHVGIWLQSLALDTSATTTESKSNSVGTGQAMKEEAQ